MASKWDHVNILNSIIRSQYKRVELRFTEYVCVLQAVFVLFLQTFCNISYHFVLIQGAFCNCWRYLATAAFNLTQAGTFEVVRNYLGGILIKGQGSSTISAAECNTAGFLRYP